MSEIAGFIVILLGDEMLDSSPRKTSVHMQITVYSGKSTRTTLFTMLTQQYVGLLGNKKPISVFLQCRRRGYITEKGLLNVTPEG